MVASVGRITTGTGYKYLADEVATSKHDYYAGRGESPGVWAGSGLHEFDLSGQVDPRDMEALYGRLIDPQTAGANEVTLGRKVSPRLQHAGTPREKLLEPIAALDVTFSPSKSVSALWAAHPDEHIRIAIVNAHEVAVSAGLAYLEVNAGHTRGGAGGVRRIDSSGFIIAKFRHRTARSTAPGERIGDPQLHTHCAILNRVRGDDDVWRTLDSNAIHRHAHAAGALYGATLERELTRSIGVEWLTPPVDKRVPMREIAGVPESVIAEWSTQRQQVTATYDRLTDDFRASHGRTPTTKEQAQLKDRATIQSRQPKAGGISDLHAEWCKDLSLVELDEIASSVHRVAPHAVTGGRLPSSDPALIERAVGALETKRSWWTRVHVYAEVARLIDDPTHESIELVVERAMIDCVCLEPDSDSEYAIPDATKFTSQRILDAEGEVLDAAESTASWVIAPHPADHLGDDQVRAVEALTAKPHQVATVIGPAGAGKTTMLESVADSYGRAGRPVCVLALAANAARVVTDETGLPAATIASWKKGNLALPHDGLVLVDEASMVPTLTLRDLVQAASRNGCRVGLVGDFAQMGSPEAGGLLRDLGALPSATTLTSVRRFHEEWERSASIELHERQQHTTINYFEHDRIIETTAEAGHDSVAAAWFADRAEGLDSLIVVDTNSEAADISATCQRLLDRAGLLGESVGTGSDHNGICVGDQIQTRDNTSRLRTSDSRRVLNRDVWKVTGSRDDGTIFARHVRQGRTVAITPEYVKKHTVLAYGATIAGAQGRTTDSGHVLVTPRTNAASLYVGMTRGRHTNHAHVITDGHDHGELDLGHKSGFHGFADAILRNPDGDTSATTVRKAWARGEAERKAARNCDRIDRQNRQTWKNTKMMVPKTSRAALEPFEDHIIRALSHSKGNVPALLTAAVRATDWRHPNAAADFAKRLTGKPAAGRPATQTLRAHTPSRPKER